MAKDVITVDGEDRVVREDTAKSYRGVIWALASVGAFVLIAAIVLFLFWGMSAGGNGNNPSSPTTQGSERR